MTAIKATETDLITEIKYLNNLGVPRSRISADMTLKYDRVVNIKAVRSIINDQIRTCPNCQTGFYSDQNVTSIHCGRECQARGMRERRAVADAELARGKCETVATTPATHWGYL